MNTIAAPAGVHFHTGLDVNYDVAVVGSGFSAIAVTINLLRLLPASRRIAVISDDPGFGRGTAYRTEFYVHRLNVPAGRMSVYPDEPDDFLDWFRAKGRPISADEFASRADYGLYLRDRLAALLRDRGQRASVEFIKAKATGCVESYPLGLVFSLNNADELVARNVVLCLGVGNARLPLSPEKIAADAKSRIVRNPWKLSWMRKVKPADTICILGSGLTMIDQVLALRAKGHAGPVHVLSRRGLIPHAHLSRRTPPVTPHIGEDGREISVLLRALRLQVEDGKEWRAVVDGLRPVTQQLWQQMTREQRSRFLRHALPWWNIHRHRLSPAVSETFGSLRSDGTVIIHQGYLRDIAADGDRLAVGFRRRGSASTDIIASDWVVNCTGMERAGIEHSPLLKEMQASGFISGDDLGLGIAVDRQSQVIAAGDKVDSRIFAIGALTAGQFWEITAVPDIRAQARDVAKVVATRLS